MEHQHEDLPEHHIKEDICTTRLTYRAPNKANGVKAYTVSQESCYLLLQRVPSIGLLLQLKKLVYNSSTLIELTNLTGFPCEEFTEVYLARYKSLSCARYVKRKFDDHPFYGSNLHISYAPEYEGVSATRLKLDLFRKNCLRILQPANNNKVRFKKRKLPEERQASVPTSCSSSALYFPLQLNAEMSSQNLSANIFIGPERPRSSENENTAATIHHIKKQIPINNFNKTRVIKNSLKQVHSAITVSCPANPPVMDLSQPQCSSQFTPRQVRQGGNYVPRDIVKTRNLLVSEDVLSHNQQSHNRFQPNILAPSSITAGNLPSSNPTSIVSEGRKTGGDNSESVKRKKRKRI